MCGIQKPKNTIHKNDATEDTKEQERDRFLHHAAEEIKLLLLLVLFIV
jgi:hypothetical protein